MNDNFHLKISYPKNVNKLFFFQSLLSPPTTNIQPLPEYKTSAAKKPRWVLSHYGMFKTVWDVLILLATIYVAIVVPYNACFPESDGQMSKNNTTTLKINPNLNEFNNITHNNLSNVGSIDSIKRSIYFDVIVEIFFIFGEYCICDQQ